MKLTITIELDNAAFQDGNCGEEVKMILLGVAQLIPRFPATKPPIDLYDSNGNEVGTAVIN